MELSQVAARPPPTLEISTGYLMHHYIALLSDFSYQLGLIGIAEYRERLEIAYWLSTDGEDKLDPRGSRHEGPERPHEDDDNPKSDKEYVTGDFIKRIAPGENPRADELQLLALNKWMFTIGDRDCYPSVPHGHLHRKTNEWPKLNPYTGRVFADTHVEDHASRLTKTEMKGIWNDADFVGHCRQQVIWYSAFAPNYAFPRARRGKLHFPKW